MIALISSLTGDVKWVYQFDGSNQSRQGMSVISNGTHDILFVATEDLSQRKTLAKLIVDIKTLLPVSFGDTFSGYGTE